MRFLLIAALAVCVGGAAETVRISADAFLKQAISGEISSPDKKITIYFSAGKKNRVPRSLERLMIQLAAQGNEVDTKLVDEAAYIEALRDSEESELSYELSGFDLVTRPGFFAGLGERLGVPRGTDPITINPVKPLSQFKEEDRKLLLESMAIHNLVLLTGLQLADKLTAVPAILLSTYFYEVFGNLSEIFKFKGQGRTVVRNGDALSIDVNPYFLFLANLAEEIAINGAMGAAIPTPGGLSVATVLENSFTFGLAKTSVDRYSAQCEKARAKATKEGNPKKAESIRRQQYFVMRAFFNGVVPVVRTLALLAENTPAAPVCSAIKGGAMAIAGCHSLYSEIKRMAQLRFLPKTFRGQTCAKALVVVGIGANARSSTRLPAPQLALTN